MQFAVKIIDKRFNVLGYFSQHISALTKRGNDDFIIYVDGSDPDEVFTVDTLIEAEELVVELEKINKHFVFKVIEYPEGDTNKQKISGDGENEQIRKK